jgi:DNA-binding NarL/FixJ family response regulator
LPPGCDACSAASRLSAILGLTPTEADILLAIISGGTDRQIARARSRSSGTVKAHVRALLRKAEVPTRTALAVKAATLLWSDASCSD